MADKIEIPEEVKLIVKDYYEYKQKESTINNVGPVYEFLNDLIQKQDNEIKVGDWYYRKENQGFTFHHCDISSEGVNANTDTNIHKAPKELIPGLEKLRGE
jgi:hypothetical protein